jgi:hypothetical protein
MSKRFLVFILVFISFASFSQEITATIKTVKRVLPGSDITVEITVNKAGVTGFMKYFQALPMDYSAAEIDSKGGSFTFADNSAKIIWISPPSADQFIMTYKITTPANGAGAIEVGGKFSYVVGNERKVFDVEPQVIYIGEAVAKKEPAKENIKENTSAPSTEVKTEEIKTIVSEPVKTVAPKTETPKPVETKKETPPIVTTPAKVPVSASAMMTPGKTYRVQIGAFTLKPHIEGVPEPSSVLLDNGMTKFFSGNFKTYEEAVKRKKEMLEKGFEGAFIVSFENGKIVK